VGRSLQRKEHRSKEVCSRTKKGTFAEENSVRGGEFRARGTFIKEAGNKNTRRKSKTPSGSRVSRQKVSERRGGGAIHIHPKKRKEIQKKFKQIAALKEIVYWRGRETTLLQGGLSKR